MGILGFVCLEDRASRCISQWEMKTCRTFIDGKKFIKKFRKRRRNCISCAYDRGESFAGILGSENANYEFVFVASFRQIQSPISTYSRALFQRLLLVLEHMEFFRAFCEGERHSSSSLISLEDSVDFVPDFFVQHPYFLEHEELSFPPFTVGNSHQATVGVAGINDYWLHSLDTFNTDFHWNKPESSLCGNGNNSVLISGSLHEEEYLNGCNQVPTENNLWVIPRDGIVGEGSLFAEWTEVVPDATACVDEDVGYKKFENHEESDEGLPLKRKFHGLEIEKRVDHKNSTNSCDNLKKRTKISRDGQHDSNTVKSKKGQKHAPKGKSEEEGKAVSDGQSCSSSSSEEEIASCENNGEPTSESMASAVTVCGKIRASRGSATDPQSVYAKKRREKINERLKILQTLVPNGTKVDISTMLEEAVQYVKFLQLQIQLLSSDDLWMYAPLAYNGFDIGLHQKMSLVQRQ